VETYLEKPWIEICTRWQGDHLHPVNNQPDYSREMANLVGAALLSLNLNYTNTQKQKTLYGVLQYGIDIYGAASSGAEWPANGGMGMGRKLPLLFAGVMLGDTNMQNFADASEYLIFQEDQQTFYVSQAEVDITNSGAWDPDTRGPVLPYSSTDIGLPDWGIRHSYTPENDNKHFESMYRASNYGPGCGTALAALMLGAKDLWNWPAFFDYHDRAVEISPGTEDNCPLPFQHEMWNTYRADYEPIWTRDYSTNVYSLGHYINSDQIIADHTVVDLYDTIPDAWMAEVKKMLLVYTGESHSHWMFIGLPLLQSVNASYASVTADNAIPPSYRTTDLRAANGRRNANSWGNYTGEQHWYTVPSEITVIKNGLTYQENNSLHVAAFGFAWCWDMTQTNVPGGTVDPVFGVRWAGSSASGPDGNARWGLDSADTALTGNSICMDTYLAATEQYISYCLSQGYTTKVFFSTGPIDTFSTATDESCAQRQLKNNYIRNYARKNSSRILFDYADILAWSNAGSENVLTWNSIPFQRIHSDNTLNMDGSAHTEDGDHIGPRGALRLAKAVWWFMARIAGWDGTPK